MPMTQHAFGINALTVVGAVRNLMLNDESERALEALTHGLVGEGSAEIAQAICDGTMTLVNVTRDELKSVDEDPAVGADYQKKLRKLYAGRVRVNDKWYTPVAYAARCRGLDAAPADVQEWGRLVTQLYCLLDEIVVGDVIFAPCKPPPFWMSHNTLTDLAVEQAEACRTLEERGRRDSVDRQLHDLRKRVATAARKGLVELSYAATDYFNAEEDARDAAELVDIGERVRAAAGIDTFPMTLRDGSIVQVPRAPFEQWALKRTALRHLAAPWTPVAYPGLKMQNDCKYHTDWVLGAGLSLKDAYGSHETSPYLDASYRAAGELQDRLGNFSATVIVDAGARSGIVGKTVAVVPNLSVEHAAALKCTAIITETGGMLAHLAIVGREQGITIMRVPDAMTRYPKGVRVHLYPTTGEVTASTYKPTRGDDDYGDDE